MAEEKRIELGPASRWVAENLKRYRGKLTYAELSARLDALGRPIPILGLRRIEKGDRRVDIDDLLALAKALGIPVPLLIYPLGHSRTVEVVPGEHRTTWDAVKWLTGRAPFPSGDAVFPTSLAGTNDDNQAWLSNGIAIILHEDHDRRVTDWRWEHDRIPIIEEAAAKAETDGERQAHDARIVDARRQLDRIAEGVGDVRQQIRKVGMVPPPIPDLLAVAIAERPFVVYERTDEAGQIREQRVVDAGSDADYELAAGRPQWMPVDAPFAERPKGFNLDAQEAGKGSS